MAYQAEILADSISEYGDRLTTLAVTFPRIVLPELNTHRAFSRNSASSRAIPHERQLVRVLDDPFIPVHWGANQPGMQAERELDAAETELAEANWLAARDYAALGFVALIGGVSALKDDALRHRVIELQARLGDTQSALATPLHKQIASRLLEPFMWQTVIVTATDWSNFFALRANAQAQPEIQQIARMMRDLYDNHTPTLLAAGEWHLPFVQPDERTLAISALRKIATARCARISYLTHDTGQRDTARDVQLHDVLLRDGHMSPFEHVARPMTDEERGCSPYDGNLRGWHQYRKDFPDEHDYGLIAHA